MDTKNSLIEKVNNRTKDAPIFFVTNDAERALGLEKVLDNYHILCIDDNDIIDHMKKKGVNIFCLEKKLEKLNAIYRNSNRLLNHNLTQNYIKKQSKDNKAYLMFFKIAPNLERTAQRMKFDILNTSSALNRKFELKIPQYNSIKNLNIKLPETRILKLRDTNYDMLVKEFKENFIVQFNRGHTGGGTAIIDNKARLDELKEKFPQRQVRIARQIYGNAYTLNACVTKCGICWGGLSYQITGVEELTAKKAGTVGNDWTYPEKLSKGIKDQIGKFTKVIGEEMSKSGFKGMFGLDLVVEKKSNIPYVIEINARQPASIPMFTKLQLATKQIPLNLLAIAEFLKLDYKIDVEEYNKKATSPFEAAQIFIRNKSNNTARVIGGIKPGLYRLVGSNRAYVRTGRGDDKLAYIISLEENEDKHLMNTGDAYTIDHAAHAGLLILCAKEGKNVSPNAEVARIQSTQNFIDKDGNIKAWLAEIVKGLNKNIILKELPG